MSAQSPARPPARLAADAGGVTLQQAPLDPLAERAVRRRKPYAWARRMKLAWAGVVILAIVAFLAVAAPLIAPYDPVRRLARGPTEATGTPGHLLGTDPLGQDVLTRVIYGARISLLVGFLVVLISGTFEVIERIVAKNA